MIFQRKHNWIMCLLYTGTFGSFIGYSAGFPLLAKTQFPAVNALQFVFLGPLVGALSRSATGWVSDRYGGGRVTLWVFALMMVGVLGVLYFLGIKDQPDAFWGFFAMFLVLFFATGVGNASTFQMIPNIMRKEMDRLMPTADADDQLRQAEKESAAITGFTSAIAAFGAFFIPKSYGTSIALTGGVEAALWGFLVFYVICLVITWAVLYPQGRPASRHRTPPAPVSARSRSRPNKRRDDEPFPRSTDFFNRAVENSPMATASPPRGPALGGRLSEALAARQDRALHAWRELHRLLLLEDLRQGRHRHLGNAADRLSAHASRHAEPRAARLLARRELLLVSLLRQPHEISARARAPVEAVARGAQH